jgi:phage gpG-like protein
VSELGRLADHLETLTRVPSQAATRAAKTIERAIKDEFRRGEDPYGQPWTALSESTKARGRTPPPMTDTEALKRGIRARPMGGAGIAITSDERYLGFHQGKGSPGANVPPRHVLPEGQLPDKWAKAIGVEVDDLFDEAMR